MRKHTHRKNERGAALAVVGICMVLLVSMAAVGVDLGRLALTANEAQVLADVGAAAGAKALLDRRFSDPSVDPETVARNTIGENPIDGAVATADNVEMFEYGTWDRDTQEFETAALDEATAVRVTTQATVENVFAPVMSADFATSRVERVAVGAMDCSSEGKLVFPVTFGNCMFDGFHPPDDCSDPPTAVLNPDKLDTACFTSLGSQPANTDDTRSLLPEDCCPQCGGADPRFVRTGDDIKVINGITGALKAVEGCWEAGLTDWVVPIVECSADGTLQCNQSKEVVGFANIRLTFVKSTGNDKRIELGFFCDDSDNTGGGGGACTVDFSPTIVF
jgi:Flp pilus assembly protein TadG